MTKKTVIEGYEVEVEIDPNSEPQSQCFVHWRRFHGSLAMLSGEGYLTHNHTDETHNVPAWIISKIEAWAEANGY